MPCILGQCYMIRVDSTCSGNLPVPQWTGGGTAACLQAVGYRMMICASTPRVRQHSWKSDWGSVGLVYYLEQLVKWLCSIGRGCGILDYLLHWVDCFLWIQIKKSVFECYIISNKRNTILMFKLTFVKISYHPLSEHYTLSLEVWELLKKFQLLLKMMIVSLTSLIFRAAALTLVPDFIYVFGY